MAGAVEYTDCISTEGYDSPSECPWYNIKQSDGETAVILQLWEMLNTPLLPLLPDPVRPRMVASNRFPSIGQIELFDHLIVCKQVTDV